MDHPKNQFLAEGLGFPSGDSNRPQNEFHTLLSWKPRHDITRTLSTAYGNCRALKGIEYIENWYITIRIPSERVPADILQILSDIW